VEHIYVKFGDRFLRYRVEKQDGQTDAGEKRTSPPQIPSAWVIE